jgi:hypothetical protein
MNFKSIDKKIRIHIQNTGVNDCAQPIKPTSLYPCWPDQAGFACSAPPNNK